MGLAERIAAARARRAFPVGSAVVSASEMERGHDQELFSPEKYGEYLATSNGVYSCAKLRADQLSGIPLKLWRGEDPDRAEIKSGPARDLFNRVNPFWTFNRLMNMTELSLCTWGEGFWALEGGSPTAPPREIWWVKASRVQPIPHPERYLSGYLYFPTNFSEPIHFEPHEMLWFRYPNPLDEYSPLSPLAAARLAADVESASLQSNQKLFSQGIQLGGLIMPKEGMTFSPEQMEDLERDINRRLSGKDKAHKWGVLRAETQIHQMGVTPKDAEFLGGLRWSLLSIARAYGVPPELLGDDKRTYENFGAAMRYLWGFTLKPETLFIASEINEQLVPRLRGVDFAEFDLSGVTALRADDSGLWDRVLNGWDKGLFGEKLAHELLGLRYDDEDRRKLQPSMQLVPLADDPAPTATEVAADEDDDDRIRRALERIRDRVPTRREFERDEYGRIVATVEAPVLAGSNGHRG